MKTLVRLLGRPPILALTLIATVAVAAGVVAGAAGAAKRTITISWSQTHHYDSGLEGNSINESNVSDACGGTGRVVLSGTWTWDSTTVLEPYGDYPNGSYNFHFVRGRITVTYELHGVTNGGVTYTGKGKLSRDDFPWYGPAGSVTFAGEARLKGSDGSVLGVHQAWAAQYGGSVFQGYLDAAGMSSYVSGGTCLKHRG